MARILVLDAKAERQPLYPHALRGHEIIPSAHPSIATKKTHALRPDLVLADWSDGLKLLEEYARLRNFTPPPVILMELVETNEQLLAYSKRAKQYGAIGFLPHTFTAERMHRVVEAALRRALRGERAFVAGARSDVVESIARRPSLTASGRALESVCELVGGWSVIQESIGRWEDALTFSDRKALLLSLIGIGRRHPMDQIIHAAHLVMVLANKERTPVQEVLWELANAACFGNGEYEEEAG